MALALAAALGACKETPPEPPAADAAQPPITGQRAADVEAAPGRAARSADAACVVELVSGKVRTHAGEAPIPLDPEQGDPALVSLAVWPGDDDAAYVALRRSWYTPGGPPTEGLLWRVPCDAPGDATVLVRRPGADFAQAALSRDGWTLFFSDARGVSALDLEDRAITPITEAGAPWAGCWSEGATMRDLVLSMSPDGRQLSVARGGPCGAEGSWIGQPWVVLDPLDADRRRVRQRRPLSALAAVEPATLWVSDGGACDEPGVVAPSTRGAIWRSEDQGASWARIPVTAGDEHLSAHARTILVDPHKPDRVVVHGAVCRTTERGRFGGEVFASEDRGATWRRVWEGRAERVVGLNGGLDLLVVWVEDGRRFGSRDLGATWFDLDRRPAQEEPELEPVRLGGAAFAPQDDGLYRRSAPGVRPTRVFPPAGAEQP
ncbi:MAG: hypothetical protein EP329_16545 [Deltaproteobacteria bacterium]|nr:MAG: hypothetical protein EP329_16545 [Deltaproteobacteria bacterium]